MPDRRTFLAGAAVVGGSPLLPPGATPFLPAHAGALARANTFAQAIGGNPSKIAQFHAHCNPQARSGPYIHLPRSTARQVIDWYQRHMYHLAVAQTGLNEFTPVAGLQALYDQPDEFLTLPSEEVSSIPDGLVETGPLAGISAKGRIIDMLCLGSSRKANTSAFDDISGGLAGMSTPRIIGAQIEAIEDAGGLPVTAHPRLTGAVNPQEFIRGWGNRSRRYVEIWNGEPGIDNEGAWELWDAVLSTGRLVYGTGGDDSFHYGPEFPEHTPTDMWSRIALPGRTFNVIRAPELTWPAVRHAMETGNFYVSTGILPLDFQVKDGTITITLDTRDHSLYWSTDERNPAVYRTRFIGKDGKDLVAETKDPRPTYTLKRTDLYARAVVRNGWGQMAWFQPIFH